MLTLVIGLPGSGKTTWVKQNLGNGLVYDLDYIAGAFRLAPPKSEDCFAARMAANEMLQWFVRRASMFSGDIYVIRTAPRMEEVRQIRPYRVIVCRHPPAFHVQEEAELKQRIESAAQTYREWGAEVLEVGRIRHD